MEIKKKERVIEETVYVANDGTEFNSIENCRSYERGLEYKQYIEAAEKLRIERLDEEIPINCDGLTEENSAYRWYKLQNKEDFDVVNTAYRGDLREPDVYPEIMCVETIGGEAYMDDGYCYHLETAKEITREFWDKLGYNITFERNDKWNDV